MPTPMRSATAGTATAAWEASTTRGSLRTPHGRKKIIRVRSFQLPPAEIEAVLHGHPAVADCAVFSIPDAVDGEAIVVAVATRTTVNGEELIDLVADRLAC